MANLSYKDMSSEMNSWFEHAVNQVTQKATQYVVMPISCVECNYISSCAGSRTMFSSLLFILRPSLHAKSRSHLWVHIELFLDKTAGLKHTWYRPSFQFSPFFRPSLQSVSCKLHCFGYHQMYPTECGLCEGGSLALSR